MVYVATLSANCSYQDVFIKKGNSNNVIILNKYPYRKIHKKKFNLRRWLSLCVFNRKKNKTQTCKNK